MITSIFAEKLRTIHRRRFRAAELNEYAKALNKIPIVAINGHTFYKWDDSEIEDVNKLIAENN